MERRLEVSKALFSGFINFRPGEFASTVYCRTSAALKRNSEEHSVEESNKKYHKTLTLPESDSVAQELKKFFLHCIFISISFNTKLFEL